MQHGGRRREVSVRRWVSVAVATWYVAVSGCNLDQAARVALAHNTVRDLPWDAAVDGRHLERVCTSSESTCAVASLLRSAESTTCRHSTITAEGTP